MQSGRNGSSASLGHHHHRLALTLTPVPRAKALPQAGAGAKHHERNGETLDIAFVEAVALEGVKP